MSDAVRAAAQGARSPSFAATTSPAPLTSAPALTGSTALVVVLNASSGKHGEGEVEALLRQGLQQSGRPHELHVARRGRDLAGRVQMAAASARTRRAMLVAVGGDGTINAVAAQAWQHGLPFGVVPQGTFNYFGRAHGLSQEAETGFNALLQAASAGQMKPVQVGLVNEQPFLVNASLGLYPQVLQDREAFKQRFGRSRWVAMWAALHTLLHAPRDLVLRLQFGVVPEQAVRTPTLFVGNNPLQIDRLGLPDAQAVGQGALAVLTLAPIGRGALLKLAWMGAMGQLGEADTVDHRCLRELWAQPMGVPRRGGWRAVRAAVDGETRWLVPPLHFRVAPRPLWLVGGGEPNE